MKKLAVLGVGNMGRAMIEGLLHGQVLEAGNIYGYAPHYDKLKAYADQTGIVPCKTPEEALSAADTLLIAVKPYMVSSVMQPLLELAKGKTILSVAAGLGCKALLEIFGNDARVQYIMPNLPVRVGAGALLFEAKHTLDPDVHAELLQRFSALGTVLELPAEHMDIATTITGCGPAFVAMFAEALGDAGVRYGLKRDEAYRLAASALMGTGKLLEDTGVHPAALKDGVCSPGGTTIRGVLALEKAGFRNSVIEAIRAIMER